MPYLSVNDFKFGMDRRRPRVAGIPGTLWSGRNVVISRGGDIERMKKFVPKYTLPAGTFGMTEILGQLYVFGSADLAASVPIGVNYSRLQSPTSSAMVRVLSATVFDGKNYVVAEYDDGSIFHFFNGTRVTAWDGLGDTNSTRLTLVDYLARQIDQHPAVSAQVSGSAVLVTASVPGTAFSISASATNGSGTNDQTAVVTTPQANVAEVDEVRASGTIEITAGTFDPGVNRIDQIAVNAVNLLLNPIDAGSTLDATANALVVAINNNTVTGYRASAIGATVTVRAPVGAGATVNGGAFTVTAAGDVATSTAAMSGGVTYVAPVAQISLVTLGGTYEATDLITITVDGTDFDGRGRTSGTGSSAYVYKERVYSPGGTLLFYSKLKDPSDWTDANASSGAGFINLSSASAGSDRLLALAQYQNSVAIFSRNTVRIYSLETDAATSAFVQSLNNTGTIAARSVIEYGNIDVFYLDQTGIRSIQARDVTNAAFVDDAGSAIDTFVQEIVREESESLVERAVAVIDPIDSRFMLALGSRVFVLSYFPKAKINAWTYFDLGFTITDFVRSKQRLYARDDATIYSYGGESGQVYPDTNEFVPLVELPFANARSIATFKKWTGFDMASVGDWEIELLTDPNDEAKIIDLGIANRITYSEPVFATIGESPMFALRLTGKSDGFASISNLAFHYQTTEAG